MRVHCTLDFCAFENVHLNIKRGEIYIIFSKLQNDKDKEYISCQELGSREVMTIKE